MPKIRNQIRQVMREMDAGSANVRPGSVLILVVVLLVLMALLGTAFLVTARNDRVATRLYSHNVQIDMLLDGVEHLAMGVISNSNASTSDQQRFDDFYTVGNPTTVTSAGGATSTNGLLADPTNPNPVDHTWLAARYPTLVSESMAS